MNLTDLIIPLIILIILVYGLYKKIDIFSEFIKGAKESLIIGIELLPTLIALMACIGIFTQSGLTEAISNLLSPITDALGFPKECIPLALLRPISGSGAISMFETILSENGADSFPSLVAAVMLGSTETTLYTIAVYTSMVKVKKTRFVLWAALIGDFMGIFDFLKPKDITVNQNCEQVKTLNQDMQIQTNGSFEFLVDDVFYINDRGIVVTGKILSGSIKLGDNVIIFPEGIGTIVTGIEQFRKKLEFAQAGELVGISLAGINKKQIHKGNKLIK